MRRRLKFEEIREKVCSERGVDGEKKVFGLFERSGFDGDVAVVVGGGEEREDLVFGGWWCGHEWVVRVLNKNKVLLL